MKFVLGCITSFEVKISGMKTKVDETLLNPICYFSTCVTFNTLIKNHQDRLTLRQMEKNDMESIQKEKNHQFNVRYMTHPMQKKNRTYRDPIFQHVLHLTH